MGKTRKDSREFKLEKKKEMGPKKHKMTPYDKRANRGSR